jgi:antitoxin CptB
MIALRSDLQAPATRDGQPAGASDEAARLDERSLSKLKWRCRRGLLENDLFIERFFRRHEETITTRQAAGLDALMDLSDHDLLDLLLARREPLGEVDRPEVREVLALMRRHPENPT